jgi:hypothetical protein
VADVNSARDELLNFHSSAVSISVRHFRPSGNPGLVGAPAFMRGRGASALRKDPHFDPRLQPRKIGATSKIPNNKLVYHGILVPMTDRHVKERFVEVDRVQTGVRIEKRLLKVLKAVAELKDMSLGDLLEGIVLHAFEGKTPFSAQTLKNINQFKSLYGMTLRASDSHHLKERK